LITKPFIAIVRCNIDAIDGFRVYDPGTLLNFNTACRLCDLMHPAVNCYDKS